MKSIWGVFAIIVTGFAVESCFEPPQYSIIPEIEFDKIQFKDQPDPDADSLILTIKFKDGDGDLGLDASETGCFLVNKDTVCSPYTDKLYYAYKNGKLTYFLNAKGAPLVNYALKRTVPSLGLPDFASPYNCVNWDVIKDPNNNNQAVDTIYFELNPNHYNIFIDFYVKQNDGSFEYFDFQKEFPYPSCGGTYDGRFPILAKDFGTSTPLEGTIRYTMSSPAFLLLFSIKTLKIKVRIQDRALHSSNTIETPEFRLLSIK